MLDTSAYENVTFPIIGYVFIGITTLALSYITFIDNTEREKENAKSASSIFPASTASTEAEPAKTGGKKYGKTIKKLLKSKKSGSSKKERK